MIDDENRETKFACNVNNVRDAAFFHDLIAECINHFLSMRESSKSFSVYATPKTNSDWMKSRFSSKTDKKWMLRKLNEHLQKVGLVALSISRDYGGIKGKQIYHVSMTLFE